MTDPSTRAGPVELIVLRVPPTLVRRGHFPRSTGGPRPTASVPGASSLTMNAQDDDHVVTVVDMPEEENADA